MATETQGFIPAGGPYHYDQGHHDEQGEAECLQTLRMIAFL